MAAPQLSFRKINLNLYLRVQTTRKQLTFSVYAPRIFLHTQKIPVEGSPLSVTEKEIQTRNEARVAQNTKRAT